MTGRGVVTWKWSQGGVIGSRLRLVAVEGEGLLDRDLDPLAALEKVDAHRRSFAARPGNLDGSQVASSSPEQPDSSAAGWRGAGRFGHRGPLPRPRSHQGAASGGRRDGAARRRHHRRGEPRRRGRGRRGRLLPRPRDGRGRGLSPSASGSAPPTSPAWQSARGSSGSSTSAGSATTTPPSTCSSRHETARVLIAEGPPLTYFRAAMVVGAGSESYRTLRYLVGRLPVMITPGWLRTDTQPIGIDATVEYLRRAPEVPESAGRDDSDMEGLRANRAPTPSDVDAGQPAGEGDQDRGEEVLELASSRPRRGPAPPTRRRGSPCRRAGGPSRRQARGRRRRGRAGRRPSASQMRRRRAARGPA